MTAIVASMEDDVMMSESQARYVSQKLLQLFSGVVGDENILYQAVAHSKTNNFHLHLDFLNQVLSTGKYIGLSKRDLPSIQKLQKLLNARFGWKDPTHTVGTLLQQKHWSKDVRDRFARIDQELKRELDDNRIKNRDDVIKELSKSGFNVLPNAEGNLSKKSLRFSDGKNTFRLSGLFFKEEFNHKAATNAFAIAERETAKDAQFHRELTSDDPKALLAS